LAASQLQLQVAESGPTAAGSTQIIRLSGPGPRGGAAVESAFGTLRLGADVPPSGSPMFTPGGRAAIRRATVAGSGHTAPHGS
jgi:hypothetical protein